MVQEKKYYVGYLDALGFSNLIDEKEVENLYNSLERVCVGLLKVIKDEPSDYWERGEKVIPDYVNEKIINKIITEVLYFSDSIMFYIKTSKNKINNLDKLRSLCWLINEIIAKTLLEPKKSDKASQLAFRGCIAKGKMIIDTDENIYVGDALKKAVKGSDSQNWMGGILHDSISKNIADELNQEIVYYDKIPIQKKNDEGSDKKYHLQDGFALDWYHHHKEDIKSYHLQKYDWDEEIKMKEHTIKFLEYLNENEDNITTVKTDSSVTFKTFT